MIEPVMYFGIGFLVAALLGLLFVPLVHNRAVRLTMRRLEAATPLSIAEIRADKDQLRAEFAMSTRRLEMSVAQMKTKTTSQLAELGKKADAINQLKKELGEKTATIFALEARDKTQREQLRTTEEEFQIKNGALREVERTLADKEAELVKLVAELGEHSITSDSQRVELAALRTQVEAMKVSVTDYERTVKDIELRRNRERSESEATAAELTAAREKLGSLGERTTELERQLLLQTTEAEVLHKRVQELEVKTRRPGPRARRARLPDRKAAQRRRSRAPDRSRSAQRIGLRRRPQLHRLGQVPLRYQAARSAARARGRGAQQAAARAFGHEARRGIRPGHPSASRTRCCASASTMSPPRSPASPRRSKARARRSSPCSPSTRRPWAKAAFKVPHPSSTSTASRARRPPAAWIRRRKTRPRSPTASARCNRPPRGRLRRTKLLLPSLPLLPSFLPFTLHPRHPKLPHPPCLTPCRAAPY